jgi:hypothetical protein
MARRLATLFRVCLGMLPGTDHTPAQAKRVAAVPGSKELRRLAVKYGESGMGRPRTAQQQRQQQQQQQQQQRPHSRSPSPPRARSPPRSPAVGGGDVRDDDACAGAGMGVPKASRFLKATIAAKLAARASKEATAARVSSPSRSPSSTAAAQLHQRMERESAHDRVFGALERRAEAASQQHEHDTNIRQLLEAGRRLPTASDGSLVHTFSPKRLFD